LTRTVSQCRNIESGGWSGAKPFSRSLHLKTRVGFRAADFHFDVNREIPSRGGVWNARGFDLPRPLAE
jgi:hypothetical protein